MLGKDALGGGWSDQQERRRPGRGEIRRLRNGEKISGEGAHALVVEQRVIQPHDGSSHTQYNLNSAYTRVSLPTNKMSREEHTQSCGLHMRPKGSCTWQESARSNIAEQYVVRTSNLRT